MTTLILNTRVAPLGFFHTTRLTFFFNIVHCAGVMCSRNSGFSNHLFRQTLQILSPNLLGLNPLIWRKVLKIFQSSARPRALKFTNFQSSSPDHSSCRGFLHCFLSSGIFSSIYSGVIFYFVISSKTGSWSLTMMHPLFSRQIFTVTNQIFEIVTRG